MKLQFSCTKVLTELAFGPYEVRVPYTYIDEEACEDGHSVGQALECMIVEDEHWCENVCPIMKYNSSQKK